MPTEISDGVFLIDTLATGAPGVVACYLIRGDKSALIDSGYPSSVKAVLSELRALGGKWQVDFLIPTHVHLDHAGALGALAEAMPDARVLVNEHGAKHLVAPSKLIESATGVFGEKAMAVFGNPSPLPAERVEPLQELYRLDLGADKTLRVIYTPGHAWHHMSVLLESERLLVTGDAVGLHYPRFDFPIPATPPPGFDQEQYLRTLAGFIDMDPAGLLVPHFGPVRENVRDFLKTNIQTITRWGSQALVTVRAGGSSDDVFELFLADLVDRSGVAREEIPDHIVRSIMLTAKGCYTYAQGKIATR